MLQCLQPVLKRMLEKQAKYLKLNFNLTSVTHSGGESIRHDIVVFGQVRVVTAWWIGQICTGRQRPGGMVRVGMIVQSKATTHCCCSCYPHDTFGPDTCHGDTMKQAWEKGQVLLCLSK